jgi:hypothetical protein
VADTAVLCWSRGLDHRAILPVAVTAQLAEVNMRMIGAALP